MIMIVMGMIVLLIIGIKNSRNMNNNGEGNINFKNIYQ